MNRFGSEGEDIIGRWSEQKLELLAKYLKAYSDIMNKKKEEWLRSYYYIDAFAGSVRPRAKEEEKRYIEGSPLRALQTKPPFDGYWFIDISSNRVTHIERLRQEFPDSSIRILEGDCNEILQNEIIPLIPYSSKQRAFVFLDPYGLQVEWETVEKLAEIKTCDIFVNFSIMGVTRLLPKNQPPNLEDQKILEKVMGGTEWINEIYCKPPSIQLDLFGNSTAPQSIRDTIKAEWLASLYTKQLQDCFPYVSKAMVMKNSKNSALYALCLASHKEVAVKITNQIFAKYEQLRDLRR